MTASIPLEGACRLADRGVIRASGADAAAFLQGQLTNDVLHLPPGRARLAGFCSAKGRLQASFVALRDGPEDVLLVCPASVLAATLKRLSMFVLRAKCRLSDASASTPLSGYVGNSASAPLGNAAVWDARDLGHGRIAVRLPDAAGTVRALVVTTSGAIDAPAPALALSLDAWRWLEVQSGIVTIEAETVDRFVPQMVNFELVGGVDFKKGCYPGQEVVARSQYRGTTRRRTFLFDCDALPTLGSDVFRAGASSGSEAVGTVANAAPRPAGGASALVEVRLAEFDEGGLRLGSPDGPALRQAALPYPVAVEPEPAV